MGTVLVTGATAGIGLELAQLFAKDGHSMVLVARRKERLVAIAKQLQSDYPHIDVDVIEHDLGVVGAGQSLANKVRGRNLHIDFLVNNAGIGTNGEFAMQPLNKELQMMDLNMRSLVELTHAFVPGMIANRRGRILNVGSTAGFQPGPNMATYYASKAFVNSWSEALHEELKPHGITVTVLTPGPTATEFQASAKMEAARMFSLLQTATAKDVAAYGYRAMVKGKAIATPGFFNRIQVQLNRIFPRFLVRKVVGYVNGQPSIGSRGCGLKLRISS